MKRWANFLIVVFVLALSSGVNAESLIAFLKKQPEIKQVDSLESNKFFRKTYQVMVRQPLDYKDTTKGFFLQRVIVADRNVDRPVVVITEGYAANYAASAKYLNELSTILDANQICIEHRYFGKSVPSPLNWSYLTVENAVTDHHRVIELFKRYYHSKWVNTGISKGGQTAMSHRSFYPKDVDVTVAYVGPLNYAVEDGRHEPYIAHKSGTASGRKNVLEFQLEMLKRKAELMPLLSKFSAEKHYTYKIPLEEVFDFSIFEFSFSFWQWGNNPKDIPAKGASAQQLFDYWVKIDSPDYFSNEGMEGTVPFFVQAAKELGYYGYDTRKFSKYISVKTSKDYLRRIFLPDNMKVDFDRTAMDKLQKFIRETDEKMIFIYGADDPWSATAPRVPRKDNLLMVVKKHGSHRTRIENLPTPQKTEVLNKLRQWIN